MPVHKTTPETEKPRLSTFELTTSLKAKSQTPECMARGVVSCTKSRRSLNPRM